MAHINVHNWSESFLRTVTLAFSFMSLPSSSFRSLPDVAVVQHGGLGCAGSAPPAQAPALVRLDPIGQALPNLAVVQHVGVGCACTGLLYTRPVEPLLPDLAVVEHVGIWRAGSGLIHFQNKAIVAQVPGLAALDVRHIVAAL